MIKTLLLLVLDVYTMLVFARVIVSWIGLSPTNPVEKLLSSAVDPATKPIQKFTAVGGLDFSPIILIFGLQLLQRFVQTTL